MPDQNNIFDKIDGRIAKKKLEKVIEMLRNESPQELKKKLSSIDMREVMGKMDEYDAKKFRQLGISLDDVKKEVTESDMNKLLQVLGPDGAEIARRIRELLK